MANLNGSIPPELLEAENKLKDNISRTEAFINRHRKVFEQLQDMINERNAGIEECGKLCKAARCSTDLFKASTAKNTKFDVEKFLEKFGPEVLAGCCKVVAKKVRANVETGQINQDDVDDTIYQDEPTLRVKGPEKWVIG